MAPYPWELTVGCAMVGGRVTRNSRVRQFHSCVRTVPDPLSALSSGPTGRRESYTVLGGLTLGATGVL